MGLAFGAIFLLARFHNEFAVSRRQFVPVRRLPAIALVVMSILVPAQVAHSFHPPGMGMMIAMPLVVGVLALAGAWMDPMRNRIVTQLRGLMPRRATADNNRA